MSGINPLPWQTDTSNGDWFFTDGYTYKTAPDVIRMLADIVSKNGNLLLNVVLLSRRKPAAGIADRCCPSWRAWMDVNAEAIHGTRPWTVFGEGPTETAAGAFKENADYTAAGHPIHDQGRRALRHHAGRAARAEWRSLRSAARRSTRSARCKACVCWASRSR